MPVTIQELRYELGDSDATSEIMSDAEYQYFIDKNVDSLRIVALDCAKTILFKLSRFTHERADLLEVWGNEYVENYREALLLYIRDPSFNLSALGSTPYAGGIDPTDVQANISDVDTNHVDIKSSQEYDANNPYNEEGYYPNTATPFSA